jgi:hypothetical protein
MKYGITYANGAAETFKGDDAAGLAREALAIARGAMNDGETVSLWSETASGSRMNLEIVTQPRIYDISAIMN